MKANIAFMHGSKDLRIENVEIPELKPNQVLVKTKACGICGSDVHCFLGESVEGRYDIAPYTPGHEVGGEIIAVGADIMGLKAEDKVTADCVMACGKCYNCKEGLMPSACLNMRELGFRPDSPGGFGEYMCKYILGNDTTMYSTLYIAETAVTIACTFGCEVLVKKFGKRNLILAGITLALASQIVFCMMSDSFTVLLEWSGYVSSTTGGAVQPESALSMIQMLYMFAPMILFAGVIIAMLFYKLDKQYPAIMAELKEREARGEL